jgi:hypothetical protein
MFPVHTKELVNLSHAQLLVNQDEICLKLKLEDVITFKERKRWWRNNLENTKQKSGF